MRGKAVDILTRSPHSLVQNFQSSAGLQDWLHVTESLKGVLEVVGAHPTVSHSTKWQRNNYSKSFKGSHGKIYII